MEQKLLGPLYFLVALIIALVFGLLYSSGAFASPGDDGCVGNCSDRNASSRANAKAYAASLTRVEQNVTVVSAAPPVATPQAAPQAAPLTINNNLPAQPEQRETVNVRTVPTVITGNVYPTAPCMGSSIVGAAALGWGASVGTSWADHECGKRETARSFQNLGMTADAVAVLCSSEYAAVAPVCMKK